MSEAFLKVTDDSKKIINWILIYISTKLCANLKYCIISITLNVNCWIKVFLWYVGNDNTFMLTNQRKYVARVYQNYTYTKKYFFGDCEFWIDDEFNNYTIHLSDCSGPLGKFIKYICRFYCISVWLKLV